MYVCHTHSLWCLHVYIRISFLKYERDYVVTIRKSLTLDQGIGNSQKSSTTYS